MGRIVPVFRERTKFRPIGQRAGQSGQGDLVQPGITIRKHAALSMQSARVTLPLSGKPSRLDCSYHTGIKICRHEGAGYCRPGKQIITFCAEQAENLLPATILPPGWHIGWLGRGKTPYQQFRGIPSIQ